MGFTFKTSPTVQPRRGPCQAERCKNKVHDAVSRVLAEDGRNAYANKHGAKDARQQPSKSRRRWERMGLPGERGFEYLALNSSHASCDPTEARRHERRGGQATSTDMKRARDAEKEDGSRDSGDNRESG